jgi:hypothetical protein
MARALDLTGQTFHRLTVIERAGSAPNNGGARWRCLCECGNETYARAGDLRMGAHRSCGCLREQRLAEARTYTRVRRSSGESARAEMRRNLTQAGVHPDALAWARRAW